jgi:gas vesicle protein GvpA/GvpJ/GvpM family
MADVEPKAPGIRRRTRKAGEASSSAGGREQAGGAGERRPLPQEPASYEGGDLRESPEGADVRGETGAGHASDPPLPARPVGVREPAITSGGMTVPGRARQPADYRQQSTNLADILERVLDKGIVIAGDIRVNLLDIELLTIKIRLLIASVDKAREIGIDWWEHDPSLSSGQRALAEENRRLRARIGELEAGRTGQGNGDGGNPREPVKTRERKPGSDG